MKQLDPKAVWLFFIAPAISVLILLSFSLIALVVMYNAESRDTYQISKNLDLSLILIIESLLIVFGILFAWVWAKLTYHYYKYALRDDGFRKEYGIIWKKYATIPYNRIQNVDIYRGLIARLLGLSDLQIQTAGGLTSGSYGAFSESRLPGLSREVAEQMRDELIKRVRHSKGQGL